MSHKPLRRYQFQIFILFWVIFTRNNQLYAQLTVSGPVTATSVIGTGSLTISSFTISTASIGNLQITGRSSGLSGTVVQIKYSSTTITTTVSTSTFVAVSTITIALNNSRDYLRFAITGVVSVSNPNSNGVLTIKRDAIDLGDPDGNGFAFINTAGNAGQIWRPVGVVFVDFPGDTNSHTYTICLKADQSAGPNTAAFPNSAGYFVAEEISQ